MHWLLQKRAKRLGPDWTMRREINATELYWYLRQAYADSDAKVLGQVAVTKQADLQAKGDERQQAGGAASVRQS